MCKEESTKALNDKTWDRFSPSTNNGNTNTAPYSLSLSLSLWNIIALDKNAGRWRKVYGNNSIHATEIVLMGNK